MGGVVAITIRMDEEHIYNMHRWTNPIPDFVHDVKFLAKDYDYFMEYINRKTEYGGLRKTLAPYGYDLIVIDLVSNKILSWQGYSRLAGVSDVRMTALIEPNHIVLGNDQTNLVELWLAGKFVSLISYTKKEKKVIPFKNNQEVLEAVLDIDKVKDSRRKKLPIPEVKYPVEFGSFYLDFSPFELIEYPEETKEQLMEMRTIVESLFNLSRYEKKLWDKYIKERWSEQ
jgi:hypothetical protein